MTTNVQRKYTVMKPVIETQNLERRYQVCKPVYTTTNYQRKYTVMKPVVPRLQDSLENAGTRSASRFTTRRTFRRKYHRDEAGGADDDGRPALHRLQAGHDHPPGRSRNVATTRPRRPTWARTSLSVRSGSPSPQDCDCQPRGLFSCFHRRTGWATVAVQCPPRQVCQTVYVPRQVTRDVAETHYIQETMSRSRSPSPRVPTWRRKGLR